MFHVVLFQPEIPPNTGNIIRLCANTGASLHLVAPLGFDLDDRKLRRAGLDYVEWASVREYDSLSRCLAGLRPARPYLFSTRAGRALADARFRAGDVFLFGPETRGLPAHLLAAASPDRRLRIPMRSPGRSLNLSNAVAVVVYEAWRQCGYAGAGG